MTRHSTISSTCNVLDHADRSIEDVYSLLFPNMRPGAWRLLRERLEAEGWIYALATGVWYAEDLALEAGWLTEYRYSSRHQEVRNIIRITPEGVAELRKIFNQ